MRGKYKVRLVRTMAQAYTLTVKADDEEDASTLALEEAYEHDDEWQWENGEASELSIDSVEVDK